MRRMIADLYKMVYKLTKNKLISLSFAILYISLLYTVTIYGLCRLLNVAYPELDTIISLFRAPVSYVIYLMICGLNFWLMLPLQNLSKEKNKPVSAASIIIYSVACFFLMLYIKYADKLFT